MLLRERFRSYGLRQVRVANVTLAGGSAILPMNHSSRK